MFPFVPCVRRYTPEKKTTDFAFSSITEIKPNQHRVLHTFNIHINLMNVLVLPIYLSDISIENSIRNAKENEFFFVVFFLAEIYPPIFFPQICNASRLLLLFFSMYLDACKHCGIYGYSTSSTMHKSNNYRFWNEVNESENYNKTCIHQIVVCKLASY